MPTMWCIYGKFFIYINYKFYTHEFFKVQLTVLNSRICLVFPLSSDSNSRKLIIRWLIWWRGYGQTLQNMGKEKLLNVPTCFIRNHLLSPQFCGLGIPTVPTRIQQCSILCGNQQRRRTLRGNNYVPLIWNFPLTWYWSFSMTSPSATIFTWA